MYKLVLNDNTELTMYDLIIAQKLYVLCANKYDVLDNEDFLCDTNLYGAKVYDKSDNSYIGEINYVYTGKSSKQEIDGSIVAIYDLKTISEVEKNIIELQTRINELVAINTELNERLTNTDELLTDMILGEEEDYVDE